MRRGLLATTAVALALSAGAAVARPAGMARPYVSYGHGLIVSYINNQSSITGHSTGTLGPAAYSSMESTAANAPLCSTGTTSTTTGTTVTTFPDGDELDSSLAGAVCAVPTATGTTYHLTGTFAITGGTGHYAGATGGGRVEATAHLAYSATEGGYRGPVSSVNRGTITLP